MLMQAETEAEKQAALAFLSERIGAAPAQLVGSMPFSAFGVLRRGVCAGVVLFTNYRGTCVEVIAAGERGWLSRGDIRALAAYAFVTLGVLRISAVIDARNAESRALAVRLGAVAAGVLHDQFGHGRHAWLYSLRRDGCGWLRCS